jgi:YVTN family beta-propeller protein
MRLAPLMSQFTEQQNSTRFLLRVAYIGFAVTALWRPAEGQDCLFVLDQLNNSVVAVARASNKVIAKIPMPIDDCPQTPCHPMPTSLRVSADGTRAYVTRQDVNLVYVLDPVAKTVVDTATIDSGSSPTAASSAAALSPDGASLYVANLASKSVSVISTATNDLIDTVGVGNRPRAVAFTPDGTTVLVSNSAEATVTAIRTADRMVLKTIGVGAGPAGIAVAPNGGRAYVATSTDASVSIIDVPSLASAGTIAVGHAPRAIAFIPDGASAFVTNLLDATVSVIDVAAGMTSGDPITVGGAPVAIAVTPNGDTAYVANLMSNTISVIDTATRAVDTINGVPAPFDVALGPTCPAPDPTCTGDCDGNGEVVISELITGVNIALNNQSINVCSDFDADNSGGVEINELIAAVNNAQAGCNG